MNARHALVLAVIAALMLSGTAHASGNLLGYFVVNYVTYLNPNGQVSNYYVEYVLTIYNNEPYAVPLNISMSIPQYSSIVYVSPTATTISNDVVSWVVNLQPYSEEELEVRFKPVYTVLPIALFNYEVLVNGTEANSTVVTGGVGTMVELTANVTNLLPFPVMTTISLTRQSGIYYEYNVTPTITQNILGYEIDYWIFNTENRTSMTLNMVVEDLGPWRSVRINPVNVQVSIDLNESIDSLNTAINELNATINQLRTLSNTVINASSVANNYTTQFLQLIALLNQTANILGASAYLINSTLLVESLLQAQLIELKMALTAEGQVLGTEANVVSQLRNALSPIVSNEQSYISTLNTLKEELQQIEESTSNATLRNEINNAVGTIDQLENSLNALNQVYDKLGTIQNELSSTQNQVNQAAQGLSYAITAANESEALIISISRNLYVLHNELLNLTNQLLSTYISMASYQAGALKYLTQIGGYEGELSSDIMEDEVKVAALKALANQYLTYLTINNSNVSIDVSVEETFVVNMPSVVNTQYLMQLLNETAETAGSNATTHETPSIIGGGYVVILLSVVAAASFAVILALRRLR